MTQRDPDATAAHEPAPAAADPTQAHGDGPFTPSAPPNGQTLTHDPNRQTGDSPVDGEAVPVVTGYEILGVLGRGGMGVVYRARQVGLNRAVALKMILGGAHAGPVERLRFLTEAEVIAGLVHPHIVPVYEFGTRGGQPFYSMEYLGGGSLADRIRPGPLPPGAAAELVEALAQAVHAAHSRGVVHRDLKPTNILYSADGTAKVVDFGLARHTSSELTATQAVLGTPSYMAPEQAAGNTRAVGPAADIYALGAILYECLTGQPPFCGETTQQTLELVRTRDPVALRKLNTQVPRSLETVCLKCLHKDPQKRYASADELAADLARFRAGEPVRARRVRSAERMVLWARRKPTQAALVAAVALLLLAAPLFVGMVLLWRAAEDARGQTASALEQVRDSQGKTEAALFREQTARLGEQQAQSRLALEREKADHVSYLRLVGLAHRAWQANEVAEARQYLRECPEPKRDWTWHYVDRLCHAERLTVSDAGPFMAPALSADGRYAAFTTRSGRAICVWDLRDRKQMFRSPEPPPPTAEPVRPEEPGHFLMATFSPDGSRLAWVRHRVLGGGEVSVWDRASGAAVVRFDLPNSFTAEPVAFSPDGARLAAAAETTFAVWAADTGKQLFLLDPKQLEETRLIGCAFTRDGRVATCAVKGAPDKKERVIGLVWDLKTARASAEVPLFGPDQEWEGWKQKERAKAFWGDLHPGGTIPFSSSPDGERIIAPLQVFTDRVRVCRVSDRNPLVLPHGARLYASAADWACGRIATTGDDRSVKVWDARTGALLRTFHGHTQPATFAVFRPGTTELFTVGEENVLRVWDAAADPDGVRFRVPGLGMGVDLGTSSVSGVWASSSDLSRAVVVDAVGDADHSVTVWDTALKRPVGPPLRIRSGDLSFAFAPDNRTLLVTGINGAAAVRRIDPTTGTALGPDVVLAGIGENGGVALSRDGTAVLVHTFPTPAPDGGVRVPVPGGDMQIKLFDAATGKPRRTLEVTGFDIHPQLSADGSALQFRSLGGGWGIVGTETGTENRAQVRFPDGDGRTFETDFFALGPGRQAALVRTKESEPNVLVDPHTGALLARLELSHHARGPVAFSPDGRLLAQWVDPSLGAQVAVEDPQRAPAWTGTGLRIWDVTSGRLVLSLPMSGEVQFLQFSADGHKLLAASRTIDTAVRKRTAHVQIFDATPRR
jgi:WD40 repeat protein